MQTGTSAHELEGAVLDVNKELEQERRGEEKTLTEMKSDHQSKQHAENTTAQTGFTILGGFENKMVQKVQFMGTLFLRVKFKTLSRLK